MVARRRIVLVALLLLMAASASAQMDMLPQIFRDLPPELQQGLPAQMSFTEYRALNRNVDFFTMFMALFVPGYGLFQVEEPGLAWGIVAGRFAGYGLMTGAVALQWANFADLFQQQALSEEDFQRLLVNSFIFGGGVAVAGLSWAADVMLAYHIAKREKDLVQYTYGVRSGLYGSVRGGADAATDAEYLRGLLVQSDDALIEEYLREELARYPIAYPDAEFAGDALYFAAMLAAERRNDLLALRYAIRSVYLYPEGARRYDSMRLVARLFERNERWGIGYEEASALADVPTASPGRDQLHFAALQRLSSFSERSMRGAAVSEAQYFLTRYTGSSLLSRALALTADLLVDLGRPEEAAPYLAALVVGSPDSEAWPVYTLRFAELYLDELDQPRRATILLHALVENAPDSEQAAEAQELLTEIDSTSAAER